MYRDSVECLNCPGTMSIPENGGAGHAGLGRSPVEPRPNPHFLNFELLYVAV